MVELFADAQKDNLSPQDRKRLQQLMDEVVAKKLELSTPKPDQREAPDLPDNIAIQI